MEGEGPVPGAGLDGRGGARLQGGACLGWLTLPANDVHQDVKHNDCASASDAGAVGTDQEACGRLTGQSRGPFPGGTCAAGPAPSLVAPAVHYHGSGPRHAALGPVHLLQEAKDAGGRGRHPVVRPAEVLAVLHCAR